MNNNKFHFSDLKSLLTPTYLLCCITFACSGLLGSVQRLTYTLYGINFLQLTASTVAVLTTVMTFIAMFMRVPSGVFVNSGNHKRLIGVVAGAIELVGLFLYGMSAQNIAFYYVGNVIMKIGSSILAVVTMVMISAVVPPSVRGTSVAISGLIGTITMQYSRPILISLMNKDGIKPVVMVGYVACILTILATLLMKEENLKFGASAPAGKVSFNPFATLKKVSPLIVLVALGGGIAQLGGDMYDKFVPVVAKFREIDITGALTIAATIALVMSFVGGVICDLVDSRIYVSAALLIGAGALVAMGRAETASAMTTAIIIYAFVSRFTALIRTVVFKMCSPAEIGLAGGIITLFVDLSSIAGEYFRGWIIDKFGYPAGFNFGAVCMVICVVIILYVLIRKRKETPPQQA